MTESIEQAGAKIWNVWRIARWCAVALLLLVPLVMMQIIDDWHWGPGGFVLAGIVFGGPVLLYEVAASRSTSSAYGVGAAVALATSFLIAQCRLVANGRKACVQRPDASASITGVAAGIGQIKSPPSG